MILTRAALRSVVRFFFISVLLLGNTFISSASVDVFKFVQDPKADHFGIEYNLGLLGQRKASPEVLRSAFHEHSIKVTIPAWQNLSIIPKLDTKVFAPNLDLPNGLAFPSKLLANMNGLVFRKEIAGHLYYGIGSFQGSVSDRIYRGFDTFVVDAMAFYGIHYDPRNFLTGYIFYSNNRVLLNDMPLPGFAYATSFSPRWGSVIGFPYFGIWMNPWDAIYLLLDGDPLNYKYGGRLQYDLIFGLSLFAKFQNEVNSYFRAAREIRQERLFFTNRELLVGAGLSFWDYLKFELAGGYGIQRSLSEVRDYADRAQNIRYIDDGFLGRGKIELRF